MTQRAPEAAGRTVAQTYLGFLAVSVLAYPLIFVGGLLTLMAYVLDHLGVSRLLGVAGMWRSCRSCCDRAIPSRGVLQYELAHGDQRPRRCLKTNEGTKATTK